VATRCGSFELWRAKPLGVEKFAAEKIKGYAKV